MLKSLLVLLALCAPAKANIAEHLQDINCVVESGNNFGSGVFIVRRIDNQDRVLVWTVAHNIAIEDGVMMPIIVIDAGEHYSTSLIRYSKTEDLALLLIEKQIERCGAIFCLEAQVVGTPVYHAGNPGRLEDSITSGIISRIGEGTDQSDATVYYGSSGGGIYTTDGELLGLVQQMLSPTIEVYIPVREIKRWSEEVDIPWAIDGGLPVPPLREIMRGQILCK